MSNAFVRQERRMKLGLFEPRLFLLALATPATEAVYRLTHVALARELALAISLLVLTILVLDYVVAQDFHFYPQILCRNYWLWVWLLVGISATAVALFRGNGFWSWMMSDIYRYVVAVLITMLYVARRRVPRLTEVLPMLVVIEVLLALVASCSSLTGGFLLRTANAGSLLFPLSLTLLLTNVHGFLLWGGILLLETLRILLSQSRVVLVQTFAYAILVPLVVARRRGLKANRVLRLVVIVALGIVVLSAFVPEDRITLYTHRVVSLWNPVGDLSLQGRLDEARAALKHLVDEGPLAVVFGLGVGSTFYFPDVAIISSSPVYIETNYQVHNIHFGPISVLFRTGIVGLCFLYIPVFVIPLRVVFKARTPYVRAIGLFLLMKAAESVLTLRFIGDPVLLILMALAAYETSVGDAPASLARSEA